MGWATFWANFSQTHLVTLGGGIRDWVAILRTIYLAVFDYGINVC
jgi:hypothetical protein